MFTGPSLPPLGLSLAAAGLTPLSAYVLRLLPLLPLIVGGSIQRNRFAPLAMSLGMTLSFAAIGVFLGALGPALGVDRSTVRTAGAAMMIAFALVMLVPALSERFSRSMLPIAGGASAAPTRLDGRSLGSALLLGGMERLRLGFALVLGAMGIAILTGADKRLESWLHTWLPDASVHLTVDI